MFVATSDVTYPIVENRTAAAVQSLVEVVFFKVPLLPKIQRKARLGLLDISYETLTTISIIALFRVYSTCCSVTVDVEKLVAHGMVIYQRAYLSREVEEAKGRR